MSALRKEYEAVFGVVEGKYFSLYNAEGRRTYWENADGHSYKYQYDAEGNMIFKENSTQGVQLDIRPCADKVFIEEKTGKKFKMTEIK